MIYLVASCDGHYWPHARPYLESLARHLNDEIRPVIFAVDDDAPVWVGDELGLETRRMSAGQNAGETELRSIQHGSFLSFLPVDQRDDLILYTDCDMLLQRPLTAGELYELNTLGAGVFAAGWNAGPGDNLLEEARRLRTPNSVGEIETLFPHYTTTRCINGGWILARRSAWAAIYRGYMDGYRDVDALFPHPSRCQWLISYTAVAAGLRHAPVSPKWHCHFHFGVPHGVGLDDGRVTYLDEPALWIHKPERFIGRGA